MAKIKNYIVVVFDIDSGDSYTESFENEDEFFERYKGDERDCEGFSWALWTEGNYDRTQGNGNFYHLIKVKGF